MSNHNLKLPDYLTEANASLIEKILEQEAELNELFRAAGAERSDIPNVAGAYRSDETVVVYADEDRMTGVPPKTLLERKLYGDGSIDYIFFPSRDEYRG